MIDKFAKMLEAWMESVIASISDGRQRDYFRGYEDGMNDARDVYNAPAAEMTPQVYAIPDSPDYRRVSEYNEKFPRKHAFLDSPQGTGE